MAWETPVLTTSFEAGADLSAAATQYKYVKLNSSEQAILCTAITDIPLGVLQNSPESGENASIMIMGITKLASNAALAVGDLVGTSADSQADPIVAGVDGTVYITGQVVGASTAAAGLATAVINCANPARAV